MSDDARVPADVLERSPAPSGTGCLDCEQTGGWWFHLRRCVECGHIGCCDDSLAQHATRHYEATGHRYLRSFEPGEAWFWDYAADAPLRGGELPDPQQHPLDQGAPGPSDRVPADWQHQLTDAQERRGSRAAGR
ncbi:UBP-type zinc finger domain-containing protein [Microbacterium capsulatum]|uniref:UBP-type zinc finger domain-containing protein n=1 Tax=Microbacterium capsulatum TaxID=3041921 RepID=A0ABU0XCR7_9MICO|nr:UBP-type zinc finger domain-containing protein [Microbacterium sp. ASV81]MDQ4212903.1 UBP-type zinc finger domain-containing protein [Microbacterium sp. ASV81]